MLVISLFLYEVFQNGKKQLFPHFPNDMEHNVTALGAHFNQTEYCYINRLSIYALVLNDSIAINTDLFHIRCPAYLQDYAFLLWIKSGMVFSRRTALYSSRHKSLPVECMCWNGACCHLFCYWWIIYPFKTTRNITGPVYTMKSIVFHTKVAWASDESFYYHICNIFIVSQYRLDLDLFTTVNYTTIKTLI